MNPLPPLCLATALLLGACASPEAIKVIPVAGGRTEKILISARGPAPAEDARVFVALSSIMPIKQTGKFSHAFLIKPKTKVPMTRILITEITEDPETTLVDERAIKLTPDGSWAGYSPSLVSSDPKLAWVNHESPTTRMYRIRVFFEDGKTSDLASAFIVPNYVKGIMKKELGL